MASRLQQQLAILAPPAQQHLLCDIGRGIEKESLRVTPDGKLALTAHPDTLGSALTHNWITTDYSEALLEFITPVSNSIEDSLGTLEDIHRYVYGQIGGEMLWTASMPCALGGDDGIPVAQYGASNVARMKTVYRLGLGHRYGRTMQTIAGIHYNFSMPDTFWELAWEADNRPGELRDYISERYLGLIRNFRRHVWLLVYLFGASPAICASFLHGREDHGLQNFAGRPDTLYLPWATSLRMGDLGYNSSAQKNLRVCYNSLHNYVETLREAIMMPHPDYAAFSSGRGGDYQQLSDSLLQIENEFYSPIRPKRVTLSGETPLHALTERGIEYIEVRCVDVNPFLPLGLDASQVRFMDAFLLFCLLAESPACDEDEQLLISANLEAVVNRGREPDLLLNQVDGERPLRNMARELLAGISPVVAALDTAHRGARYTDTLQAQRAKVEDASLTPSARMLDEMRDRGLSFFALGLNYSERWAAHFRAAALSADRAAMFAREARRSLQAQRDIEAQDTLSFEQYLANFYSQYHSLPGF